MKILVTGAGGFLGSEVVRRALADGHDVVAMIRNPAGRAALGLPADRVVIHDLGGDTPADPFFEGVEGVIHCAAVTSAAGGGEALSQRINVEGTLRLLEGARKAGVRRWVQISSMSAHPGSTSIYGRTKLAADEVLRAAPTPPEWVILRPSLIYGEADKGLVAKTLGIARKLPVLPMLGSGQERLRPVHVADVAAGALHCLTHDQIAGKTYLLGGADEVTLDDFMRRLLAAAGLRRPILHLPIPVCLILAHLLARAVKNPPITVDNVLGVREAQPVDHLPACRDWGWKPRGLDAGLAGLGGSGLV